MSLALIQYVLKAAIRDRLMLAMLLLIILTTSMSMLMASAAINEQDQFLAVYTSGSLRILSVLGLVVFTAFFVRRSFDLKDVEFLLSRPISRINFVLSYAVAFSILALILSIACGVSIYIISPNTPFDALMLWTFSIMIETVIMVNMSFAFAMMFSSAATIVLATLAFYVLARMMGQILGIIASGTAGTVMDGVQMIMNIVSAITPRLDLMGQTSWLVYGIGDGISFPFVIMQGAIFLVLILAVALIDLVVRQF